MALLCPDCKAEVETIIACGCRDYFCNTCNQMVSKKRVIDSEEESVTTVEPTENVQKNTPI